MVTVLNRSGSHRHPDGVRDGAFPTPRGRRGESKVNAATGARKIDEGVEETVTGIGHAVVESAKYSAQKIQEAGKAAEPQAKGAGENVRDGAVSFGQTVKTFFTRVFGH